MIRISRPSRPAPAGSTWEQGSRGTGPRGRGRLAQDPALDRNRKRDVYRSFGIPTYWIVEPDRDRPELTVFELRSGAYEQTAQVIGDQEYRAVVPFPVTIVPSKLVTTG